MGRYTSLPSARRPPENTEWVRREAQNPQPSYFHEPVGGGELTSLHLQEAPAPLPTPPHRGPSPGPQLWVHGVANWDSEEFSIAPQHCHLLTLWPWAVHVIVLRLSFLICKRGMIIIILSSQGCFEDHMT